MGESAGAVSELVDFRAACRLQNVAVSRSGVTVEEDAAEEDILDEKPEIADSADDEDPGRLDGLLSRRGGMRYKLDRLSRVMSDSARGLSTSSRRRS